MNRSRRVFLLLLLGLFLCSPSGCCLPEVYLNHPELRGTVVDAETGAPVTGAKIMFAGGSSARSKEDGSFTIHKNNDFGFKPLLAHHRNQYYTGSVVSVSATGYKTRSWLVRTQHPTRVDPLPLLRETSGLRYRVAAEMPPDDSDYRGCSRSIAYEMSPPQQGETYLPADTADTFYARPEVGGEVLDALTRKPIANAQVLSWIGHTVLTDGEGRFSLPAESAKSKLTNLDFGDWSVRAQGYQHRYWIDTAPLSVLPPVLLLPEKSGKDYIRVKDATEQQDPLARPGDYAKPARGEVFPSLPKAETQ